MDSTELATDITTTAKAAGADLVGIASIDCFDGLPPEKDPRSIFPECTAVIVLGRRVLRGALRGVEEGTNFGSTYRTFGFTWLEDNFLSQTTYDVTCRVESMGFEAVPIFGYAGEGMAKDVAVTVAPGKPAPNVYIDVAYAAQAAGLGAPGAGGFFLTPRFGNRQRFALILTDAEPATDAVFTGQVCDDCGACIRACPFQAIRADKAQEVGVPGATRAVATVDLEVCAKCPNGAQQAAGRGASVDRLAAACGRACTVHLEEVGRCENRFAKPFRKRSAWTLDAFRRPVEPTAG